MPFEPDDRPFDVEQPDPGVPPATHPLVTRRTALLGLGATGVLAGLGVMAAGEAAAEASPAPSTCRQLITVNTGSAMATTGSLSAWTRSADGGWRRALGPIGCHVGSLGVGKASEGSSITPAGAFPLNVAFGRQPNPGTRMSYFRTDPLDWWDENPTSPTYNLHVRRSASPGGNSENLYYSGAVYDYAVNINHNPRRIPYAGSGIFLHVTDGGPTAGCVSIDRSSLVSILRWLRPDYHPYAAIRVGSAWGPTRMPVAQGRKFVATLFRGVLGRAATSAELAARADALYNGADRRLVTSQVAHSAEKYRRVVTQAYQRVLHRNPAAGPLASRVATLAAGGRLDSLYISLAGSDEAWRRAHRDPATWVDQTCVALIGRRSATPAPWITRVRHDGREITARKLTATAGFTDRQLNLLYQEMLARNASAAAHRVYGPAMRARGVFDQPATIASGSEFWARSQR
jgi:L,D-peptidoglycan transpeptidase YkuD (ErfK/YbiS/YcfS/YnhG family)